MLDTFLLFLLVPVCLAAAVKLVFRNTIHWLEAAGLVVGGAFILVVALSIGVSMRLHDTQILNGEVLSKKYQNVSCSHSYSCNCRTDKDGSTSCDTCYEHAYDRDWLVETSVGSIEIDRVDRRGLPEPPRWSKVEIGEPVSVKGSYSNYIKASPYSLYSRTEGKDLVTYPVPAYPSPFDYYRINRVQVVGSVPGFSSAALWNDYLNRHLRKLGPGKQVNLNVVVTSLGKEYGPYLESAWLGGKKNDVTLVVGSKQWPTVDWAYAFTYAKSAGNEQLVVELREALLAPNATDSPELVTGDIARLVSRYFHRKPMVDFKYLANEIAPSASMVAGIIAALAAGLSLLTYLFHKNSFNSSDSVFSGRRRRRRW